MKYSCINAYYFQQISAIGGIESHLYYIGRKYGKSYDITVFYRNGDAKQIKRLKQYIRVIQLNQNDDVECVNLFCCFNRDILNHAKAKTKYLVLHGDYKAMMEQGTLSRENLPMDERIDKYIGVSQTACDSWKEITGFDAECVYEPVVLNKAEKPLLFVSATRLSREKGWSRMLKLADALDSADVNYQWLIYTNSPQQPRPNMIFAEPRLDIADKLGSFDAFIQLSDNEGYCLSVVEALKRKVPVICTDLPVLRELGLNDSNSIRLPLDMSDIPIEDIKHITQKRFTYTEPNDLWSNYFSGGKPDYRGAKLYKVKATDVYQKFNVMDTELGFVPPKDFTFTVDGERLKALQNFSYGCLAEVVNGSAR